MDGKKELLETFSNDDPEVNDEMYGNINDFNESEVEFESISLSCDMIEMYIEDTLKENWPEYNIQEVGVICRDRSLDIYVNINNVWFSLNFWQRVEGEPDFLVYDISVGPISLAQLTLGTVNSEFTDGFVDGMKIIYSGVFTGRKIEEINIDEDGVMITGRYEASDR
ncbi:hypothetical protein JW887_06570 [Candidatus Dojkabacteria bacterium]|nr:hypothetical protein [Candidatus Dojkabacteria bacterium]